MHVAHLAEYAPTLVPYLALARGGALSWRRITRTFGMTLSSWTC